MGEVFLTQTEKNLINNFEVDFANLWDSLQAIQAYVNEYHYGDRWAFLDALDQSCDYCTTSKLMRLIFDFSER